MNETTLSKPFTDACPTRPSRVDHASTDIPERIRILAAQGLKPRDISALLGVHPMIVVRLLGEPEVVQ